MILLSQRLFGHPNVTVLLQDGNVCVLEKRLSTAVYKKERYISNHVIVLLLEGEQRLTTYEECQLVIERVILFLSHEVCTI